MADLQRMERALRNADAAGDVEAAKVIARALKAAMAEPAKPKTSLVEDVAGYVNKGVQTLASGATAGFADEIGAGLDALPVAAYRSIADGQPFDVGKAYDDRLQAYRGDLQSFRDDNPGSALVGEIAGAVISPAARLGAGYLANGVGTAARMGRGAVVGGGFGAAYGAGNAEGGAIERAKGAGVGGVLGAGVGAAAVPAIDLVSGGVRKLAQSLLDRYGRTEAGQRKVIDALTKANGGDARQAMQAVRAALTKGDDLSIADVGGINAQRQARAVANVPGESSQIADDFIAQRTAGRGDRLRSAADELAPAANMTAKADALTAQAKNASRPIYARAVNPDRLIPEENFAIVTEDPFLKSVIGRVKSDKLAGMKDLPDNSMPVVDAAKKRLDDMIGLAQRQGANNRVRMLSEKRDMLVTLADDAVPEYAAAREAYGTPVRMREAMEQGQKFLRGEVSLTRKELAALSEEQQAMFRLGARKAIDDLISSDTQAAVTRFADKKEALWAKLRAVFPNPESFARFKGGVEQEIKRAQLERFVNPRGGSQTTPLAEDIAELSRVPSWILDAVDGFRNGGDLIGRVGGAVKPLVANPMQALSRPDEKVAADIARTLLSLDRKTQDAFFRNANARVFAEDLLPVLKKGYRDSMSSALTRATSSQGQ